MKILVLTSRFPYPLEKGDKLRIYYQIRELHRAGFEVVLIALTEESVKDIDYQIVKAFCSQIFVFHLSYVSIFFQTVHNILRGVRLPFQVSYFYNRKVQKAIEGIIEKEKPDRIHCHLARMSPYVEDLKLPKTLDFMDAFGAGTLRRADISPFFLRPFWQYEASLMQRYEQLIASKFDFSTIISQQDKQRLLLNDLPKPIYVVPNGVDVEFFNRYRFKKEVKDFEQKYDICFVGNLGYYSNVEAVRFLVKKIIPLVKAQKPDVKILLAGARPTAEVCRFEDENITVVGWLDDIREAYAQSSMLVAPLMHGIGQQNKILEAMSMELPVVTTPRVNQAIGSEANHEILLADTAEEFSKQILRLLEDVDLYIHILDHGLYFVHNNYSWKNATQVFIDLLKYKKIES